MYTERVSMLLLTRKDLNRIYGVKAYAGCDYIRFEDDTTEEEFINSPLFDMVMVTFPEKVTNRIIYNVKNTD